MQPHPVPPRRWAIGPDQAYVWLADPGRLAGPEALRLARDVLSAAERARMRRLLFARDRRLYLLAHALLRHALSACAPSVPPAAWTFVTNRYGRPELARAREALRFNLSHTEGLVACVVTRGNDCGIDVELAEPRGIAPLGWHVLARRELASLAGLPDRARARMFFRYWTLKEAYVKARGRGMSLPLDACVFELVPGGAAMVGHPPDDQPDPDSWQFLQSTPTERHILAVAVRTAPGRPVRITQHPGHRAWGPALAPAGHLIAPAGAQAGA